jgi:hypothetical protein
MSESSSPLHIPSWNAQGQLYLIDFKLLLYSVFCILSSGLFTSVCNLSANVSEHSVCSIFIGEQVWSMTGVENVGYIYGKRSGSKNSLTHSKGG